jgi:hypothetical protein
VFGDEEVISPLQMQNLPADFEFGLPFAQQYPLIFTLVIPFARNF